MEEKRERWQSRTAFVMAAIGSAVGLGNVWRFPVKCFENGGGAFFIPYFVALLTAGVPLMILEYGVGQMMQGSAPTSLRKVNRHTEWVGWFALLVGMVIAIYYAVILAYSVEYLVYAFNGFFHGGVMPWSKDPAAFFTNEIRHNSLGPGEMWAPVWPVVIGLAVTWAMVYVILCRGVQRVGKVVMWTVPLPVVVLGILLVRGLLLPGAGEGIKYYLTPKFELLLNSSTWLAAYGQIFFSLTLGFGVMIAYASYMPRKSDIVNNAFITSFANCATSFFAGFVVFSVLGYLAFKQGTPVGQASAGGPGLVFVTYPTAISEMKEFGWLWPPIVGVLFFIMLLSLGIDSLFSLIEGVVAGLHDRYPWLTQRLLTGLLCAFSLVLGVIFFGCRAGLAWLDVFDHWANDRGLALVGLLECVIIGYFFHTDKLRDFINEVSEIKLWGWWELCIRLITPLVLGYLLFNSFLEDVTGAEPYGTTHTYFDRYLWIAPATFALLFVIAFALARLWKILALVGGGTLAALITHALLPDGTPLSAPILCGFSCAVLFGGLILCVDLARRSSRQAAPPPAEPEIPAPDTEE